MDANSIHLLIGLLIAVIITGLVVILMQYRLQAGLNAITDQITPFWSEFQKKISESLHHPHPESQPMDRLLEKLESLTITEEETKNLETMLHTKLDNESELPGERSRAELLLFVMPRVVKEREDAKTLLQSAKKH